VIARLICRFLGHRRGKRLPANPEDTLPRLNTFACPRCKATWTRKAKAAA
jgi:hypothetical protein